MGYFTKERQQQIVDAIREAELNTSGEIRVHVDKRCRKDVLDRALYVFKKLKMEQTRDRNGVLLYVAVDSHKTAIIGDEGVNAVVPPDFWNGIIDCAVKRFAQGEYTEGIAEAVTAVGEVLKQHFPYTDDDINELPDEISFGDD
ncbi:MAG: TPM domain-containing protein [Bacteroidales bacterium]|nr:TPM domain-containing protein [Bacteroidales bacterium]